MSQHTLRKEFFDDLWPQILNWNKCDTRMRRTTEYYVPEQQFAYLWAHDYLARKGWKDYKPSTELTCRKTYEEDKKAAEAKQAEHALAQYRWQVERWEYFQKKNDPTYTESHHFLDKESKFCEVRRRPTIVPLDVQLHRRLQAQQHRQKVAYDFVNRRLPWYMQRPIYEEPFELSYNLELEIDNQFEVDILRNIHTFRCKLMLIDVGATVTLRKLERWLKFCRYVKLLAVVRCEVLARRLLLFDGTFSSLLLQQDRENTWQEELMRSLRAGVKYAKQLHLFEHCAVPFVFLFSRERDATDLDTFKILRKF